MIALTRWAIRNRWMNRLILRRLPRKRMGTSVLLFDGAGKLLLVKPVYLDDWLVPGGLVEANEAPWQAARRETAEEVGVDLGAIELAAIDWLGWDEQWDESMHFVFRGGVLEPEQIAAIRLPPLELAEHRFLPPAAALALLEPKLGRRIKAALEARAGVVLTAAGAPVMATG